MEQRDTQGLRRGGVHPTTAPNACLSHVGPPLMSGEPSTHMDKASGSLPAPLASHSPLQSHSKEQAQPSRIYPGMSIVCN